MLRSAVFSPDGRLILSGDVEGGLILWEAATGGALRTYHINDYTITGIAFYPDGQRALIGDAGANVYVLDIAPYADDLYTWVAHNRYVPELTCEQRATFLLEEQCDAVGSFPRRTPAAADTIVSNQTPVVTAPLPVWTPIPTLTPLAPLPVNGGTAIIGENHGALSEGSATFWRYEGQRGERLTIQVTADFPVKLTVQRESGLVLAVSDTGELTETELLRDGLYEIIVESADRQSNGTYVLVISTIRE
jgi:WD40 repeat protein